jgi:SpoIIAA-like
VSIELHHERDNIFRVRISGALRARDLSDCAAQLLNDVERIGPVRLLFVLDTFEGWSNDDDWRDLSFYVKHGDAIERIAIVGDEQWRDLALMFAAADLRKAPVEYFAPQGVSDALVWLSR